MLTRTRTIVAVMALLCLNSHHCNAWVPVSKTTATTTRSQQSVLAMIQSQQNQEDEEQVAKSYSRRDIFSMTAATAAAASLSLLAVPLPALAKEDEAPIYYNAGEVQKSFDVIRYELEDPKGGIAYLQECIDKVDYDSILEFTKTYDLELRKAKMSAAKKKYKMGGDLPTQLCNNVTFDLIGMNKSCRKGQENIDVTKKYMSELRTDIGKFLELQSTILVVEG